MRTVIAIVSLGFASSADADTYRDVDTLAVDVATVWEPSNADAFGAGPMLRFETFSSRLPDWLGVVTRGGIMLDSADRIFAPVELGLIVRPGRPAFYGSVQAGMSFGGEDDAELMDTGTHVDWLASATLGYRHGAWNLNATALVGGLFEHNVWMFSVGRDLVRLDSTITRTTP